MRLESCREWRGGLAAWALGNLDGSEASEVVAHMGGCEGCRAEIAELSEAVAALEMLDPPQGEAPQPQPPSGLADEVSSRITDQRAAASRGLRWRLAAAAGLVAVAVAVATAAWWPQAEEPPGAAVAVTEAADGLDASVGIEDREWGASVSIVVSGIEGDAVHRVWVEDRAGERHPAGSFRGLGGEEIDCYMTSATSVAEAAVVGIDGPDGAPVLRGEVRAEEEARGGP